MTIQDKDIVQLIIEFFTRYKTLYNEMVHWFRYRHNLFKLRTELESQGWITTFSGMVYKKAYYPPFEAIVEEAKKIAFYIGALTVYPTTIKKQMVYIIFPKYHVLKKREVTKLVLIPLGIIIAGLTLLI